jgi:hypothetical protein
MLEAAHRARRPPAQRRRLQGACATWSRRRRTRPTSCARCSMYRRDADDKLMLLFTKPQERRGQGLFCVSTRTCGATTPAPASGSAPPSGSASAAPTRGAPTSTSRAWPKSSTPRFEGDEKLGKFETLRPRAHREGPAVDVAYPVLRLWVDKVNHNILKRQEFALSGKRLMPAPRTTRSGRSCSRSRRRPSCGSPARFASSTRSRSRTRRSCSSRPSTCRLARSANLFTKAWLEAKSR